MKLDVVLKSKNPYVSDETWNEMVAAKMATFAPEQLQQSKVNPFELAEIDVTRDVAQLFDAVPEEKSPEEYLDLDYGPPPEGDLTKDEVLTIRSMRRDGLGYAEIADILGFSPLIVQGVVTGRIYPCWGGVIHWPGKEGLQLEVWDSSLVRMTAAVLAEAMTYLTPNLFELLCNQNGYEQDKAFDMLSLLEMRNDEEDRAIYRSFLCGGLAKAAGQYAPNSPNRRSRTRRR